VAQWISLQSFQSRRFASGESAETSVDPDTSNDSNMSTAPPMAEAADVAANSPTSGQAASPLAEVNSQNKARSTVYVGNLFFDTNADKLRETFGPYGEIKSVSIATDSRGLSRGFGFVEFLEPDAAKEAIIQRDQQILDGRRMAVQIHTPRPRPSPKPRAENNTPSRTLFIGNMSFDMTDRDLNDLFRDVRNVLDVRVAIDRRSGQPRGFAHADFLDVQSAEEAAEMLRNKVIYGRQLRVDFSTPSSQRRNESEE